MHPLADEWCIWEHTNDKENWKDNLRKIFEFDTVEEFWNCWGIIPEPDKFFFTRGDARCDVGGRSVVSYSIFKKGIEPMWEDPIATKGGEWRIRRFKSLNQVSHVWEQVTLLMIGNSLSCGDSLIGVRVVDSSHTDKCMYNVEIWFDDMEKSEEIQESFRDQIENIDVSKMYLRSHSI